MAKTVTTRPPETKADKAACRKALDALLAKYDGNKNEMSRQVGYSRNSVSWWFSEGYIGHRAAVTLSEKLNIPLAELRPDIAAAQEKQAAAAAKQAETKTEAKPKTGTKAKPKTGTKAKPKKPAVKPETAVEGEAAPAPLTEQATPATEQAPETSEAQT